MVMHRKHTPCLLSAKIFCSPKNRLSHHGDDGSVFLSFRHSDERSAFSASAWVSILHIKIMSTPDFYRDTQATFVCANSVISSLASRLISIHIYAVAERRLTKWHTISQPKLWSSLAARVRGLLLLVLPVCLCVSLRVLFVCDAFKNRKIDLNKNVHALGSKERMTAFLQVCLASKSTFLCVPNYYWCFEFICSDKIAQTNVGMEMLFLLCLENDTDNSVFVTQVNFYLRFGSAPGQATFLWNWYYLSIDIMITFWNTILVEFCGSKGYFFVNDVLPGLKI